MQVSLQYNRKINRLFFFRGEGGFGCQVKIKVHPNHKNQLRNNKEQ
jgi:hypothetical protein